MRKLTLCLALAISLIMLCSQSWAGTLLFDGTLKWRSGGTHVVDQTTSPVKEYDIGNPTGSDLIEIFQKDFILTSIDEDVINNPSLLGLTKFTWGVVNDNYPSSLYSFHVKGQGFRPYAWGVPTNWTFEYSSDYEEYYFYTTASPIGSSTRRDFYVITDAPGYTMGTAAVDTNAGHTDWVDGNGFWVATHPAPEPSSMLLLGMGLFGFAGRAIRKRFKA